MDICRIFNVFSKRPRTGEGPHKPLTQEFRIRVIRLLLTTFPIVEPISAFRPEMTVIWWDLRDRLLYCYGLASLTKSVGANIGDDIKEFLFRCEDERFLDSIELFFLSDGIWDAVDPRTGYSVAIDSIIANINACLEIDALPYHLTGFTYANSRITSYPQIVRRDSAVLHETAIAPALVFLSSPRFSSANSEFLDAHKDFRAGKYRDCVTKCCSSLESVMKIIYDSKGWPYDQNANARTLLKGILQRSSLEPYFEQPIVSISTIRNRLSTAHGAGVEEKTVSKHVANYVINATAAAILLLIEEVKT